MKVCSQCGTPQKDENTVCIECGAVLGKPVSGDAALDLEKKLETTLEKGNRKTYIWEYDPDDPFAVPLPQKLIGIFNILLALASIITMIAADHLPVRRAEPAFFSCVLSAFTAFSMLFPELDWELNRLPLQIRYWMFDIGDDPPTRYIIAVRVSAILMTALSVFAIAAGYFA